MDKLIYFPLPTKSGYGNPYSQNFKDSLTRYYNVLDMEYENHALQSISLLKRAFVGDVFIFNWLENVSFWTLGKIQFVVVLLALAVIKKRKAKVVWMLHNIRPHQGENKMTKFIQKWLFKNASLIISHSRDAAEYAQTRTTRMVVYRCHPIKEMSYVDVSKDVEPFDILVWGTILPYKGVLEFLESSYVQKRNLKIKVIGRCNDDVLNDKIKALCNDRIVFENRKIEFSELRQYVKASKIVLFPYIGDCVSSSGALIDTIMLKGNPVGPSVGAFKDLAEEGVCFTYSRFEDLDELLNCQKLSNMALDRREIFIQHNSWESFGSFLYDSINKNVI